MYLKICLVIPYDLLYNKRIYIELPTIEIVIMIPSAKVCIRIHSIVDRIVLPSTEDYFMIHVLASSIL